MGLHEPRMGEAMAELPVGEHLEEWEPGALGGERAWPVLRRADGWWDVVPVSTAIRAPQVLLWLTDSRSERRRMPCCLLGVDWGETHHDLCLLDQDGGVLAARRIADGLAGVGELHLLVAAHAEDPGQVAVGIETDRGLLVGRRWPPATRCTRSTQVMSRYRGRHGSSRAKSDRGDAKVLADLVRTDRHNHRQVAGDSSLVEAVKVLARAHQSLIWLASGTSMPCAARCGSSTRARWPPWCPARRARGPAMLALAPTPEQGRQLTRAAIRRALVAAGRRRNLQAWVVAVHDALAAPQLAAPMPVQGAYRQVVAALVATLRCLNQQITGLEQQLASQFDAHPDAAIIRSQPGLGVVLGARVLGEFGDDPHRYASAKGRKAFAGTAPVTRSSGLRTVVVARAACNQRLVDACYLWAFAALSASPGARRCYGAHRARGATHHQALRALGNRLVGILHGCLAHRVVYQEQIAWPVAEGAA
jgi:hypothetical protein